MKDAMSHKKLNFQSYILMGDLVPSDLLKIDITLSLPIQW